MPRYRAFGATIESDVELEALAPGSAAAHGDSITVAIELRDADLPAPRGEETEWYRPDDAQESLRITVDAAGDFRFRYADGAAFLIRDDGGAIIGCRPPEMSPEEASEYLLGPVLGFALRRHGVICLHAAAIAAEDRCFAVLAPAGHGKSTTAAACARLGWSVLTDDVLALRWVDGTFWAQPAYPRIRLWPRATAGLFGSEEALPRLSPTNDSWDKRYLDLSGPGYRFQDEPLPLRGVYIPTLGDRAGASLAALPRASALVELLGNVYTRSRPHPRQRALEFAALARLASAVPVKRIRGPLGFQHLPALCRALRRDLRDAA